MLKILVRKRPNNRSLHKNLNRLAKVYAKESQPKDRENIAATPFSL